MIVVCACDCSVISDCEFSALDDLFNCSSNFFCNLFNLFCNLFNLFCNCSYFVDIPLSLAVESSDCRLDEFDSLLGICEVECAVLIGICNFGCFRIKHEKE